MWPERVPYCCPRILAFTEPRKPRIYSPVLKINQTKRHYECGQRIWVPIKQFPMEPLRVMNVWPILFPAVIEKLFLGIETMIQISGIIILIYTIISLNPCIRQTSIISKSVYKSACRWFDSALGHHSCSCWTPLHQDGSPSQGHLFSVSLKTTHARRSR